MPSKRSNGLVPGVVAGWQFGASCAVIPSIQVDTIPYHQKRLAPKKNNSSRSQKPEARSQKPEARWQMAQGVNPLQVLAFLIREVQIHEVPQQELLKHLRDVYQDVLAGVQNLKEGNSSDP